MKNKRHVPETDEKQKSNFFWRPLVKVKETENMVNISKKMNDKYQLEMVKPNISYVENYHKSAYDGAK